MTEDQQQELLQTINEFRLEHHPDEPLTWDYVQWWIDAMHGLPQDVA